MRGVATSFLPRRAWKILELRAALRVPLLTKTRTEENIMGRYLLLWLVGIPLPILALIWIFGGLH